MGTSHRLVLRRRLELGLTDHHDRVGLDVELPSRCDLRDEDRRETRSRSDAFLDDSGVPMPRYHRYLDQTQSALVLAEGIRDAYGDLFRINRNAHEMSTQDVKNKMKTLSEGAFTDRVLTQMAGTFTTLVKDSDFSDAPTPVDPENATAAPELPEVPTPPATNGQPALPAVSPFGSLAYNFNIQLPESRDPAVYNAIFKALREHFR